MPSGEQATSRSPRLLGVLALQGAFARHAEVLAERGHRVRLVRDERDFADLEGLVLPGGESTVMLELCARAGLDARLSDFIRAGHPVLATCAGLILLAHGVSHPAQRSFDLLDVDVARNAYGRQLDSFEAVSDEALAASDLRSSDVRSSDVRPSHAGSVQPSEASGPLPLVFIRAPRIERMGPRVEVLARHRGEPVLVREGNITAATFHPELTCDPRVHDAVFG